MGSKGVEKNDSSFKVNLKSFVLNKDIDFKENEINSTSGRDSKHYIQNELERA